MRKGLDSSSKRTRQIIAQEAARIIVGHGIRDYYHAKQKAADRLGINAFGSLPGNKEIEKAIARQLRIFGGKSHEQLLRLMRNAALSAMTVLKSYSPRLVGPVLAGTADENSTINLHVFADSPEIIALEISDMGIKFKSYERRLKTRHGQVVSYAGFEFSQCNEIVQATTFPLIGIRQAPLSPINGKPMKRADKNAVQELLNYL